MRFSEAIEALMDGKKIKRKYEKVEYYLWNNSIVFCYEKCVTYARFTGGDILCNDWEIVGDKLQTFEEAIKALKAGKCVKRLKKKDELLWDHLGCIKLVKEDILADDWIIED